MGRFVSYPNSKRSYLFCRVVFFSTLLSFCSVNYGFVVGYSSNAQVVLKKLGYLPKDDVIYSSIVNVAALIGSALGGFYTMDEFGRKKTLILSSIFMIFGWLLMISVRIPYIVMCMNAYGLLISARIFTGIGLGINAACVQIYVSEIILPELAKILLILPTLFLTFGVFLCFILSYLMLLIDSKDSINVTTPVYSYSISMMPLAGIFLSVYQLIVALIIPESPGWLNMNVDDSVKREYLVLRAVNKVYGSDHQVEYFGTEGPENGIKQGSIWKLIRRRETIKAATLGVIVMFLNNFTGVYAILYNATNILSSKDNTDMLEASKSAISVGATVFLGAVPSIFMGKYSGRRKPFIIGSLVLMIPLIVMAVYYQLNLDIRALSISMVVLYFIIYGSTWSYLPWVFMAEISQIDGKGIVVGMTTQANWLSCFIVTLLYAPLSQLISQSGIFWFFSACCLLTSIFCLFFVPETKSVCTEDIRDFLNCKTALAWPYVFLSSSAKITEE